VGDGPVLCSKLPSTLRRAGFRGRERGEARGDRHIGTWLHIHVVRRVGVNQLDLRAIYQSIHILRLRAIATEEAVVAKNPQVAGLRDGFIWWLGDGIRINK